MDIHVRNAKGFHPPGRVLHRTQTTNWRIATKLIQLKLDPAQPSWSSSYWWIKFNKKSKLFPGGRTKSCSTPMRKYTRNPWRSYPTTQMEVQIRTNLSLTRMEYDHQRSLSNCIYCSLYSNHRKHHTSIPCRIATYGNTQWNYPDCNQRIPTNPSQWMALGQRYRNYQNFNEYQAREFILRRIAWWLLATNTVPPRPTAHSTNQYQSLTGTDPQLQSQHQTHLSFP